MLSAVILSQRSYPALQLALQLVYNRLVILGPLVQKNGSFNFFYTCLNKYNIYTQKR